MSADARNAVTYDDVFGGPPRHMLGCNAQTPCRSFEQGGSMTSRFHVLNASSPLPLFELPVFGDDWFRASSTATAVASDDVSSGRMATGSGSAQDLSPRHSFVFSNDWYSQDDAFPVFGCVEPTNSICRRCATAKFLRRSFYSSSDGFAQDPVDSGCAELKHDFSIPSSPHHIGIEDHRKQHECLLSGCGRARALGNATKWSSSHRNTLANPRLCDSNLNVREGPGNRPYDNLISTGLTIDSFPVASSWLEKHHLPGCHSEADFPFPSPLTNGELVQDNFIEIGGDQLVDCFTLRSKKGASEKAWITVDDVSLATKPSSKLPPVRSPPTPPAQHEIRSFKKWESEMSVHQSFRPSASRSHSGASGPTYMKESKPYVPVTWLSEKEGVLPHSPLEWHDGEVFGSRFMDVLLDDLTKSKLRGKAKFKPESKMVQMEQGELKTESASTRVTKNKNYRKLECDQGQLGVQEDIKKERQWRRCSKERCSVREKEIQKGIAVEAVTEGTLELTEYITMDCLVWETFAAGRHKETLQVVDILDKMPNAEACRASADVLTGFGEPCTGNRIIKQKQTRAASESCSVNAQNEAESITGVEKKLQQESNDNGTVCSGIPSLSFRRISIHRPDFQNEAESITGVETKLQQALNDNGKVCSDIPSLSSRRGSIFRSDLQAHVQDMEHPVINQTEQSGAKLDKFVVFSFDDIQESELGISEHEEGRWEYQLCTRECAANALEEKKQYNKEIWFEQEQNDKSTKILDNMIKRWSAGKEGNLRALLSNLQHVLWPDSGWQPIPLTELIEGPSVKKAYRKATLLVHPDKMQQKCSTIQQKYVTQRVFSILQESWEIFHTQVLF